MTNFDDLPQRELYSVKETRTRLGGISHQTFYNLVNDKSLQIVKIGRRTFVTGDEIKRFAASLTKAA